MDIDGQHIVNINGHDGEQKMLDFLAIHFGKGQGKIALEYMKVKWMDPAVADPDATNPELKAFFREGERNVVRLLQDNITSYNEHQKHKED